ncbi:asparagine synthase-related protein [Flavobacteriaceae bacterium]|nr:asparagine synthase-related protein [Flavobacteriaceae bacterium]
MKTIKTSIIPIEQTFINLKDQPHELDYKAICVFSALGFFLDTDTYWKDKKVLPAASINKIDDDGFLVSSEPWFEWHYKPKNRSLENVTNEFSDLFEKIVSEQCIDKKVILPISGGLDSRSQAVALHKLGIEVNTYSYSFENGYNEAGISKKIAKKCNFLFQEFTIPKNYLWDKIDELSAINSCYSEFTHPRQMAVIDDVEKLGDVFSLGHWGDVLFDSENLQQNYSDQDLIPLLKKKIIKKGGLELAKSLWQNWKLEGEFEDYLNSRILVLLSRINIVNSNAKIRAFKSMYWAPRWTSINLSVFARNKEIYLPYYDDRMCQFICEVPESLLNNRQIQIEYIKKTNIAVAKIVWQDAKPFHLYNHHLAKTHLRLPYRIINKLKREFENLKGKKFVQRNWELQFLTTDDQEKLTDYLQSKELIHQIDIDLIKDYLNLFYKEDQVRYSHSVSTLLTLSLFFKNV